MSSTPHLHRTRSWLADSFWTADAVLIGMFVFFIVLGAWNPFDSAMVAIVLGGLVGLWFLHVALLHRREQVMTAEARRARERRGY